MHHAGILRCLLILSHHVRIVLSILLLLLLLRHHHHHLRRGTINISHEQISLNLSFDSGHLCFRGGACDDRFG